MAVLYLKKNKYLILERNFRLRNGEVDIIAIDTSNQERVLTFIEVKTRYSNNFGTPLESIGYYKLQALRRTAQYYKSTHKGLPDLLRIDAVSVFLNPDHTVALLELVKNIS